MSMRIESTPILDPDAWAWLHDRLDFGETVGSWMPADFEAYARVLHPAHTFSNEDSGVTFVSWREVSTWSGKPLHRTSSFYRLALHSDGAPWRPELSSLPLEGELESPFVDRLTRVLRDQTSTPAMIWFVVWSGYGSVVAGNTFKISRRLGESGRSYVLRRGAIDSDVHDEPGAHIKEFPSFWWPSDRAWFVSTDIDSRSTYVGGSRDLLDGLLADSLLEVVPAELTDPHDGEATPEEVEAVLTR